MVQLNVNGNSETVDAPEDLRLLWALRDFLQLTGTKFGCGVGMCGACTVHVNGAAVKSCVTPLAACTGKEIATIEGLGDELAMHPVQRAWLDQAVSQCGYCQPGQIMAAAALLKTNKNPTDQDIDDAMAGNVCRCGTYPRIRAAIKRAVQIIASEGGA
jgi:isoquinoline 1-oxidoreductase alpha subunit